MTRLILQPHGGALRSESPITHTPPELRCVAVSRNTGQRCKAIRVRGHTCCRMHGGSAAVIKRYREELHAICTTRFRRKPARLEWLLARLARVERNRPRAHSAKYERRHATETERLLAEASAKRAMDIMRGAHAVAVALRPYRPGDCLMASARLALAWAQTRQDIERVMLVQEMASWLGLDTAERVRFGELLAPALGRRSVMIGSR